MAASYLPYEPQQQRLLPDALQDWLPEGHLAYFISDTVDALDFMLSTATSPYCPQPARSGTSHCNKQTRRAKGGLNTPFNPFWNLVDPQRVGLAGHSYGAQAVSYIGQQDSRVKAVVAWDNLCHPDGQVGGQQEMLVNRGLPTHCQTGFQLPAPTLHTPALGISSDYLVGPVSPVSGESLARAKIASASTSTLIERYLAFLPQIGRAHV